MATISASIFKKYDIRGLAAGDSATITAEAARRIGQAFGTYLQSVEHKLTVVVGRDNRRSSPALAQAAIEGLRATGCDVIDIGMVSTPVVYWHAVQRDDAGAFIVTGSHLAPEQNGFKLAVGNRNLFDDQIQQLRQLVESGDFVQGEGLLMEAQGARARYIRDLHDRLAMPRPLNVVVDAGNGTGGLFALPLFDRWGHIVTCLYCEPDGDYPNHPPDPQTPENLRRLGDAVRGLHADVGIAFDGDADRMGVVDERGEIIAADRILALLARDMLSRHPGATVVADVLTSQALFDTVTQAGGKPVMWASGHSLVKAKMRELGALLGGEMSGHIFLAEDYFGFDDAHFAAGRLLQLLGASDQPLSALNASIPTYYNTPEYRPHCSDDLKQTVIEGVKAQLAGKGKVVDVDGVRIQFDKGWGLLRASNTEPVLSLRFEAETEADALSYRDLFAEALKAYPQVEPIG